MQISRPGGTFGAEVRERSGWMLPIAIVAAIGLLSAFFLLYYLAPNPRSFIEEHEMPSSRTDRVHLSIGGLALDIPANYLRYASARRGGSRREIALFAKLPELSGYSAHDARLFDEDGAHSPIVRMLIRADPYGVPETARLNRIYLTEVTDARGGPAPFGLVKYVFRDDSGYRGEDLFVGRLDRQTVVMRCTRATPDISDPSCQRESPLPRGAALTYRFTRSRLGEWREIAQGVQKLVANFTASQR